MESRLLCLLYSPVVSDICHISIHSLYCVWEGLDTYKIKTQYLIVSDSTRPYIPFTNELMLIELLLSLNPEVTLILQSSVHALCLAG